MFKILENDSCFCIGVNSIGVSKVNKTVISTPETPSTIREVPIFSRKKRREGTKNG